MQNQARTADGGYLAWIQAVISVLGARIFAALAAFAGNVLVALQLGDTAFGHFYLLFTIMTLVAGLTGPAIDTSLVRFAARHMDPEGGQAWAYFKLVLYVKCMILAVTMLSSLAAAAPLHAMFFGAAPSGPVPAWALILAFFGGAAVSMWGFAQSYFQANQQFARYAGYEFCSALLRLGLVLGLIGLGVTEVLWYLVAYVSAPLTMALFAWSRLPRELFAAGTNLAVGREFFRFARWVILASIFTTITQRMDLLLLGWGHFEIPRDHVGRYAAAVSLVLAGELVLLTFYNVLLPKASQLKTAGELRQFLAQFRIPSLLFCLLLSLGIPIAPHFRRIVFGVEYAGMEVYFNILLVGVIAGLACAPAITAFYARGYSRLIAALEGVRLVLTLGIGLWAVPNYGAWGMAWTMAGVRAATGAATYVIVHRQLRRWTEEEGLRGGALGP